MVMTQESPTRPLRADARRNREAIIAAADDLFRVEGMAMQMETVAQRAGLGVGTVYRHFPTKEALMVELVVHRMDTIVSEAELAFASADPAAAIRSFIHAMARMMGEDVGLRQSFEVQNAQGMPIEDCAYYREDLHLRKLSLVEQGQAVGVVRADLEVGDFDALMCGLGSAILAGGNPERMADVILDGMRVPCVGPAD